MGWCRRTRLHSPQFIASITADLDFMPGSAGGFLSFIIFVHFCSDFGMFLLWGFVIIREIKVVGHEQIGAMMKDLDYFFLFLTARV